MEMNIKRSTRLRAQKIDPARAGAVASVSLRASPGRAGQRKSTTATASARGAPVIASKIEKRNRRRRNFSSRHQGDCTRRLRVDYVFFSAATSTGVSWLSFSRVVSTPRTRVTSLYDADDVGRERDATRARRAVELERSAGAGEHLSLIHI